MRGNPATIRSCLSELGSIPACAGEPSRIRLEWRRSRVYPRVCGGTFFTRSQQALHKGLSPRVRGNPYRYERPHDPPGSIPACAGEPPATRCPTAVSQVYPRVCGGTLEGRNKGASKVGLSPRVRGNPGKPKRSAQREGSIPACAGEPLPRLLLAWLCTVYPRVCGGTPTIQNSACDLPSLSPRVRGNRIVTEATITGLSGEHGRISHAASTRRVGSDR